MAANQTQRQMISKSHKSSWVDPADIAEKWAPLSLGADGFLAGPGLSERTQDVVRLGDLLSAVSDRDNDGTRDSTAGWVATTRDGKVCIIPSQTLQIPGLGITLPDEAVVIGKRLLAGVCCAYWSRKLFDTNGVADSTVRVLIGRHGESVAWLVHELQQEYCIRQLQRAAHGSITQRIALDDLLDVLVPARTVDERDAQGQAVIARCTASIQSIVREDFERFFLTAATFEDRLSQFEIYVLDKRLVSEGNFFLVEASTSNPDSDLFVVTAVPRSRPRSADRPALSLQPAGNPRYQQQLA